MIQVCPVLSLIGAWPRHRATGVSERESQLTDLLAPGYHSLKRWLAKQQPPAATVAELQAKLDRFRTYYNTCRPHRALGRRTPGSGFRRSDALDRGRNLFLTNLCDPLIQRRSVGMLLLRRHDPTIAGR